MKCEAVAEGDRWVVTVAGAIVGTSTDLANAIAVATGGIIAPEEAERIARRVRAHHSVRRDTAA